MVNFFRSTSNVPGIRNSTNTSPVSTGTTFAPPTNREQTLSESGLSTRDLSNILSSVQGSTGIEDFDFEREFDREFGTGELSTERENVPSPDGDIVVVGDRKDSRLRLSALAGEANALQIYGPRNPENILFPLHATRGLLFPYTPSVSVSGESNWTKHDLVHTNYDVLSYQRTPSANIQVTGKFTVQNQREGEYALAAIHFLRTVTKMYYGNADSAQANPQESTADSGLAGLPPPVLVLHGYGNYMFNDVRVVCQGYSFSFDDTQDLVNIITPSGGEVMLPPLFSIQVNLGMQQSPARIRDRFSLNEFRTGELLNLTRSGWF